MAYQTLRIITLVQLREKRLIPLAHITIEMGSIEQGKTYLKDADSLLDGDCVNRGGLDLSKEVL